MLIWLHIYENTIHNSHSSCLGLFAVSWPTNRTFAQASTNGSASSPALQKAKMVKMDSFKVENLTLDQVIGSLNQQSRSATRRSRAAPGGKRQGQGTDTDHS
jgi:hypothetical protein